MTYLLAHESWRLHSFYFILIYLCVCVCVCVCICHFLYNGATDERHTCKKKLKALMKDLADEGERILLSRPLFVKPYPFYDFHVHELLAKDHHSIKTTFTGVFFRFFYKNLGSAVSGNPSLLKQNWKGPNTVWYIPANMQLHRGPHNSVAFTLLC